MSPSPDPECDVFVLHAEGADERELGIVLGHLRGLYGDRVDERAETSWLRVESRLDVPPGAKTLDWVRSAVRRAHVVVVLISPALIRSPLMDLVVKAMRNDDAMVVPVLFRPTLLDGGPFETLQLLPKAGPALTSCDDLNAACVAVATAVRNEVLKRRKARAARGPGWHTPGPFPFWDPRAQAFVSALLTVYSTPEAIRALADQMGLADPNPLGAGHPLVLLERLIQALSLEGRLPDLIKVVLKDESAARIRSDVRGLAFGADALPHYGK